MHGQQNIETLNPFPFLDVRGQVSHPYNKRGNITNLESFNNTRRSQGPSYAFELLVFFSN